MKLFKEWMNLGRDEDVQEHRIILTWEAIYDITGITDYIEYEFGRTRADRFEDDIRNELKGIAYMAEAYEQTQISYRGYMIHKKPFPPSVIFYIVKEKEIHILRVLREERNWRSILGKKKDYTYPDK